MVYRVELTPRAVSDIEAAVEYIGQAAPTRVERWFLGLMDAVNSLDTMPERFPVAPESEELRKEIRQAFYGKRTDLSHHLPYL